MKLQEVIDMWKRDCEIHPMNLDEVSRNSPSLHAKYLELLMTARLKLKREKHKQKVLLRDKWLHFSGKMSKEDIDAHGWEYDPFNGLKVMKSDISYYFESDPDLQRSEESIEYWQVLVDTLKEIVDSIKWRHQTVRNVIDWHKFTSGA